jgi:hypothetical protein
MNTLETPIIQTEKKTFTRYSLELTNFVLHKEVTLVVHLFNDVDNYSIKTIHYKVEGDEYIQWGDDDSYIETIVQRELQKLNTETAAE